MIHMKENTNVIDLIYGQDACEGLGKEIGKFCVMTMDIPWKVSKDKLGGTPLEVVFIETMEEKWLDQMCDKLTDCDTVVGIGGGIDFNLSSSLFSNSLTDLQKASLASIELFKIIFKASDARFSF